MIRKNEGCPNKDLDRFARDHSHCAINGTEMTFEYKYNLTKSTTDYEYPLDLNKLQSIILPRE